MTNLLLTGGSGFLGRSVIPLLNKHFSIQTAGIGNSDNYKIDLSISTLSLNCNYDAVVHAAGKVHSVQNSLKDSMEFFNVNVKGTKNLCKSLEKRKLPKAFIFISTVAVYGVDSGEDIKETNEINGASPYSLSKIEAEEYLKSWCKENDVKLGILRPSLIAGINPPGNLGAMINGIKNGKYLRIGDGSARKSVLMAEDIANLIPKLLEKGGTYNVCDNHHPSFVELEELIVKQLQVKIPKSIPFWLANSMAIIGDLLGTKAPINTSKLKKITKSLTFSNEKAKRELDWEPLDVLQNFKIM